MTARAKDRPQIDWTLVEEIARPYLPRVLGLAGFTRRTAVISRYAAKTLYPQANWPETPHARHLLRIHRERLKAATPKTRHAIESEIERIRTEATYDLAEWLDNPVWVMVRDDPPLPEVTVEFDPASCAWASRSGGAQGNSIVSLVSWMLSIRPGQAAYRIVRACGREETPLVTR
jgi:hypothetical protein